MRDYFDVGKSKRVLVLLIFMLFCSKIITASSQAAPPPMPREWNQAEVQRRIDNIEQSPNMNVLKFGYFMHRANREYPTALGYEALKQACIAETIGSRRWFYLHSTLAFAALRLPKPVFDDAFSSYNKIFDNADKAYDVKAGYCLRKSINEYSFTVNGIMTIEYINIKIFDDARTRDTYIKSWHAYAAFLKNTKLHGEKENFALPEPNWDAVYACIVSPQQFMAAIETVLNDADVPDTFANLYLAAVVVNMKDKDRSIQLLLRAEKLLPTDDLSVVTEYYGTMFGWIDGGRPAKYRDLLPQVVALSKNYIRIADRGYSYLAQAYIYLDEREALSNLITQLSKVNANQQQAQYVVDTLTRYFSGTPSQNKLALVEGTRLKNALASRKKPALPKK